MTGAASAVDPSTYALFVLAAATLIATPGPDTLFVLSRGTERPASAPRSASRRGSRSTHLGGVAVVADGAADALRSQRPAAG